MRKNPYDKILKRTPKEQYLNTVPKSCSIYIYIYIYTYTHKGGSQGVDAPTDPSQKALHIFIKLSYTPKVRIKKKHLLSNHTPDMK